eukprot:CAMPEP_0202880026 /NCGR_PEP_ID=MMETSP1391-20130828/34474_1 /ASSEMBLY_ACC=CAM_ASM_000867 /TAXON_ID=1034604 /ORGANISM="Chlamydomonas leiostraca, Strain SAG 11-49" /LENGTH=75 /DNA_ID=CAMNT_0049562465 /DNA_START=38 /DNA_END=265 /DNA_ORIENTATION=-
MYGAVEHHAAAHGLQAWQHGAWFSEVWRLAADMPCGPHAAWLEAAACAEPDGYWEHKAASSFVQVLSVPDESRVS